MPSRADLAWDRARHSLWFIPGLLTVVGLTLALALVEAERVGLVGTGGGRHWLIAGGPEGVRTVLGTIAGSLMTVTGVDFSILIVALQLGSSQFSPRVLRNFTTDRVNQFVLGTFIGTFTYSLVVLRAVRSADDQEAAFVPTVAVTLALLLALVSVGCLIYLIAHAARAIQVGEIIQRVRDQALRVVAEPFFAQARATPDPVSADGAVPTSNPRVVVADRAGYLQAVDEEALFELADGHELTIRMDRRVGQFALPGLPLASVWPAASTDDVVISRVRGAFVLGSERTPEQDVEFGILQLADIALRALSPAINDPTTAGACIDRLGEVLVAVAARHPLVVLRTGARGELRFIARHLSFDEAVGTAFDQIRHFGADNPGVAQRLLETIGMVATLTPEGCRVPLARVADALLLDARAKLANPVDLAAVERAGAEARSRLGSAAALAAR